MIDIGFNVITIDIDVNVSCDVGMDSKYAVRSPQDLGVLIEQARRKRGQSQRELAAEFGTTQAWLSRVEQGSQRTWIGQVLRLVAYLEIDLYTQSSESSRGPDSETDAAMVEYPDIDKLV